VVGRVCAGQDAFAVEPVSSDLEVRCAAVAYAAEDASARLVTPRMASPLDLGNTWILLRSGRQEIAR